MAEFIPCDDDTPCPDDLVCFGTFACDGEGFCHDPDIPTCGGFLGDECPEGLVCMLDAFVADGDGVCVTPEFGDEVCMEQMTCWQGC
jgi:hypothetical protein